MAPRVRETVSFAASPQVIAADVLAEPFHVAKLEAIGGAKAGIESFVTTAGGDVHITLRQELPRAALPAAARPFVAADLILRRQETWSRPRGATLPVCRFTTAVAGVPLSAKGTVTLLEQGTGTGLQLDVSARITIPFVGRALQGIVTDVMRALVDGELGFARTWFAT